MGRDDLETLQPIAPARSRQRPCPTLTIVFHPVVERIGERLRLGDLPTGEPFPVSRTSPLFGGAPLDDQCLSRRPFFLIAGPGGSLTIDPAGTSLAIDGEPAIAPRTLAPAALTSGVVLEVAERVVLLVHTTGPPAPARERLGLVGENEAVEELRRDILRVADLDVAVLIRGETGTGKELVARAIHEASTRARRPFLSVNMAAIAPATAASELFGHARGAFTGAQAAHAGYFGAAEGGTLFLDEIGATPADVQPMLLRALESLEIQPVGVATPRRVDVRIVAATDADLEEAIDEGSFRAAVLHRLEGYQAFIPPLRRRRDDIGRLMLHFLRAELAATGELDRLAPPAGAAPPWLPPHLAAELARFAWPGNVRQLRNVIRQLCISSRGLDQARLDDAVTRLFEREVEPASPPEARRAPAALDDAEILAALRAHDHQIVPAAAALGVSRSTLYNRIRDSPTIRQAKDLTREELLACHAECRGDLAAMASHLDVSRRALSLRLKELGIAE